jgi:hypothetical protein
MRIKVLNGCFVFILFSLIGCAGVETFHYYQLSSFEKDWTLKDRNTFEYFSEENILSVEIKGKWHDKDLIGPFPLPIVPEKNVSEPIKIHIYSKKQLKDEVINNLVVILDEAETISSRNILRMDGPEQGFYYFLSFQRPNYLPRSIQIKFGDLDLLSYQKIKPLTVSVQQEKCYWYGDTSETYVNCKGDKLPWEN